MTQVDALIKRARPDVVAMEGYKSARSQTSADDGLVFLDANECAFEPFIGVNGYSRYSGQQPIDALKALATFYDTSSKNVLITRGADEGIELLIRTFCRPTKDSIIINPPAFAMYQHSAVLHATNVIEVPMNMATFQLDIDNIKAAKSETVKLVFLCSPNNPTGNLLPEADVRALLEHFSHDALVVVDEAYIDFSDHDGFQSWLPDYPNLILLRTFSKAQAAAGVRFGSILGHPKIIELLAKVHAPYPVPEPVVDAVLKIMNPQNQDYLRAKRAELLEAKAQFEKDIATVEGVLTVYPTETNFTLMKVSDADGFCQRCRKLGFIIRNQSKQPGLENHVRISIGSPDQMEKLVAALKGTYQPKQAKDRTATVLRETAETAIRVDVNLDQTSPVHIQTGIGFYDHMLEQIGRHGGFALSLECRGDLHVDPHHTIEDCAIALGQAIKQALGDKRGIGRYGFTIPMDEALAQAAIDLSGRFHLEFNGDFPVDHVGDLPTDMVEHIFRSLAENLGATLHISVKGDNAHHMVEGCFKAVARALRQAIRYEQNRDEMPSTKGAL